MTIRLDGKTAIVTGACAGIGRAITLDLASRGVHVLGCDRNPEPAPHLAEEARAAGGAFTFIEGDVSRWADSGRVAEAALAQFGRIDILVNNAGISRPHRRMEQIEEADWRAVSGVTLEGTIAMTRHVLPAMIAQKDGVIIHIASAAATAGFASMGAYCIAKAGVVHHAKVVAVENIEHGIRCNALIVGATETEAMTLSLLSQADRLKEASEGNATAPARGHYGSLSTMKPAQVAQAVALLCSEEAREINGAAIAVDRGVSAGIFTSRYNQLSAAGLIPPI